LVKIVSYNIRTITNIIIVALLLDFVITARSLCSLAYILARHVLVLLLEHLDELQVLLVADVVGDILLVALLHMINERAIERAISNE